MLPGGLLTPALAEGAQMVVLSGYTASQPSGPVRVVLDQRGEIGRASCRERV